MTAMPAKSAFTTAEPTGISPGPAPMHVWMSEARALLVLAGPMVVTQLAQVALITTDIIMLGRFSKAALASATIANALYYMVWLFGFGPASAVAPVIAHIRGEKPRDRAGVRVAVRMGLLAVLLVSVPLVGLLTLTEPVLRLLGQDPALTPGAGVFALALAVGLPFSLIFQVLRNFAAALGRPNAAMWVMGAAVGFNVLADWSLIFGHLGLPALGLLGAGIATSTSQIFSVVGMAVVIRLTPDLAAVRIGRRLFHLARARLAEILRLGLPIAFTMMFEAMLFNAATLAQGAFGIDSVAAHQIALNSASISFMVPLGIGMAATVRVGLSAGARDLAAARRSGLVAMIMGVGFIAFCGVAMALAGRQIASFYFGGQAAQNQPVIALAALFLTVAAAFQVADALQVVGSMSLRGLKDTRVPMILAGGAYWLAGAPMGVALAFGLHMQGVGLWIGLAFGLAVAALFMCGRFLWLTRRS
jgi:MATE family multidrug resistance protein